MLDEVSSLPIQGVSINWDKIDSRSYLRGIEAIAVNYGFNPEGGTKNYNFSTYDSNSELCDAIRLSRGFKKPGWGYLLRAESFYNVASAEEEYSMLGGVPQHFHERSHGESFLQMVQSNFRGNGLYLLDEPEAALSPRDS